MNSLRCGVPSVVLQTVCAAWFMFAPAFAIAAEPADEAAIRRVIASTWDQPEARVDVGPVVVVAGHAVASWTQGHRGGRALMARDKDGQWSVAACAGDGLKDAKTLESAGLSSAEAKRLSASLAQAERSVPAARRALFSTFDGLVRMDAQAPHAAHAASGSRH